MMTDVIRSEHRGVVRTQPSTEQLTAIYHLRYRVYVEEMRKPYASADHWHRELRDEVDDASEHLFVEHEGVMVGALRLTSHPRWTRSAPWAHDLCLEARPSVTASCLVSRLVVDPSHRGARRTTIALMVAAYEHSLDHGLDLAFCHAASRLVPFFQKFGWRPIGSPFAHADSGTSQVPLELSLTDLDYLRAVKSPFVSTHQASLR